MSREFETVGTVPELTLEPFNFKEEPQPPVETKKQEVAFDDSILSEEEKQAVEAFAEKIDFTNSTAILQYGAGAQKKMADFSESALENVKTKDLGEVGELLSNVVKELKNFDEEEEKGFLGIFKKSSNKLQAMKAKNDTLIATLDEVIQIQQEGRQKRAEAEQEMARMEQELKTKLLHF